MMRLNCKKKKIDCTLIIVSTLKPFMIAKMSNAHFAFCGGGEGGKLRSEKQKIILLTLKQEITVCRNRNLSCIWLFLKDEEKKKPR